MDEGYSFRVAHFGHLIWNRTLFLSFGGIVTSQSVEQCEQLNRRSLCDSAAMADPTCPDATSR